MKKRNEFWKPIKGYEELYQVSSYGNIRRITKTIRYPPNQKLRPGKCQGHGKKKIYLSVSLCKDGVPKTRMVHHLVIEAFIGVRPHGYTVNHIDGEPRNNNIKNLEYLTHKDNCIHAWNNGFCTPHGLIGSKHPKAKLREKDIPKIREYLKAGKSNIQVAKLFHIGKETISAIKTGRLWKHVL